MKGALAHAAQWGSVTEDRERGEAIRRRRLAQGFRSLRQFAAKSGVSREAITAAENGLARQDTYLRLEAFLDAWEHEVGEDVPPGGAGQFQLTVEGEGLTVTAAGPSDDPDGLAAAVAALFRNLQKDRKSGESETDL